MEKLNFVVSQVLAVMQLLALKNSSFNKRALARYVLIRIKDFIGLARVVNNNSQEAGSHKRKTRQQLNALSELYGEFLQKQRDKFSGHMQDLDLLERYNLWLEIDFDRLNFFVLELLGTYRMFSSEADYLPKVHELEFIKTDKTEIENVNDRFNIEDSPRMATDIFALTRFNTGGLFPMTGAQVKISVLSGLELLLEYEAALVESVNELHLRLVVKSLILLDVISYLDNLYTRPVVSGALQEMDGLDQVLKKDGRYPEADKVLLEFSQVFEIENIFASYRIIRNKVAAHVDETESLHNLIEHLENLEIGNLLQYYKKLQAVLRATCQAEFTLRHLIMPLSKMNGVIAMSMQPERAFDQQSIPKVTFEQDRSNLNDSSEYMKILNDLLSGKTNHEDARSYFWQAFEQSEEAETAMFHGREIILRKAHVFFRDYLLQTQTDEAVLKCLQIVNLCKNGYPDQLEYILATTHPTYQLNFILHLNYIYQFGELCRIGDPVVIDLLESEAQQPNFYLAYHAVLSLAKIEVRNNGSRYINTRTEASETKITSFIFGRLSRFGKFHQFIVSLLLLSELWFNPLLATYAAKYEEVLIKKLKDLVRTLVDEEGILPIVSMNDEERALLLLSLEKNIFTNIVLLVADKVDVQNEHLKKFMFQLIADNTMKIDFRNEIFVNHLGFALFKMDRFDDAESVYRILVERNPDKPEVYLNLLELFSETKNLSAYSKTRGELSGFRISQELQTKISELDAEIGFAS